MLYFWPLSPFAAWCSSWVWWRCPPPSSQVGAHRKLSGDAAWLHLSVTCLIGLPLPHPAEYCSRGSLYDCLAAAREQPAAAAAAQLTWQRRLGIAIDAGTGLLYLHRRNILHRNGEAGCGMHGRHWSAVTWMAAVKTDTTLP